MRVIPIDEMCAKLPIFGGAALGFELEGQEVAEGGREAEREGGRGRCVEREKVIHGYVGSEMRRKRMRKGAGGEGRRERQIFGAAVARL